MAFRQRQSRGPCYDDPEAGPGPSTARFYSRSDTAPHVSDAYNSTSTSPDDDARALYSDEELIVTADTYPTPNDDHQVPDIQPVEEELASHVAMFLPSGSSQDDLVPQTRNGKIPGQRREGFRWCNEFVTDGLYKPYSHAEGEPSVEMTTLPPTRRRAISLDTFDGSAATPQWPGNVPAVRVHQPPFPPPARIPTPQGSHHLAPRKPWLRLLNSPGGHPRLLLVVGADVLPMGQSGDCLVSSPQVSLYLRLRLRRRPRPRPRLPQLYNQFGVLEERLMAQGYLVDSDLDKVAMEWISHKV
ncbi:hypothetical protein N7509_010802 [Penicillium cosmopolitanum]|uniref:Uncharacterized protein n=1 Tax=Penicillium cosmopolitanum TaxID=1131564 RepID=A0A9W9VS11_9EURO|nr:uncharacterized protein N7509_010802 [Penicillium cosmopolitanum]KAJ5388261.1 hypothetical protein N7509_010802 [Penicillium cosmopolitanum]